MFNNEEKQKFFDEWYNDFCKVNDRMPTTEEFWTMVDTINKVFNDNSKKTL